MATIKYDVVTVRTDQKSEKKYYTNIGRVLQTEKGFSLKLDVVPVGWDGWAAFYTPKPKEDATQGLKNMKDDKVWDEDESLHF